MQVVAIKYNIVYFEFDCVSGQCEYTVDDDRDVEIDNIQALEWVGEIELDYILTDQEQDDLIETIIDYMNDNHLFNEDNGRDWMERHY